MTVMPDNAGRLFEDVTGLYALGVNQFVIGHATGVDWPVERMQTYTDELARVLRWYEETPRDDLRIAEFEQADGAEAYFGCQAGRISITVAVNGEISPCAKVLALDNRNLLAKLGDVRYGLTHLKNRSDLVGCGSLKAACEREGIAADFRGGCFAANYEDTGNLFVPSLRQHQFTVMRRSTCGDCSARGRGPAG
jgi:uncharacterized protein